MSRETKGKPLLRRRPLEQRVSHAALARDAKTTHHQLQAPSPDTRQACHPRLVACFGFCQPHASPPQVVLMDGPERQACYDINKDFMERMLAEAGH